jgi:hypothetical protein
VDTRVLREHVAFTFEVYTALCSFQSAHQTRLENKLGTLRKHIVQFPKLNACKFKTVFIKQPHLTGRNR